jgi:acyl-CoA synthetase (AMP-forming)/AMP-acid ligase II
MVENMGDVFTAATDGDAIALVDHRDAAAPWRISYRELEATIMACSRGLVRAGLRRGDRVGILSANRAEYIAAFLAIVRAGMVAVPVNYKVSAETVLYVFADSEIRLAFADEALLALAPKSCRTILFDRGMGPQWDGFLEPGRFETVSMDPDEEAAVFYTSGSTGRPKGVPLLQRGQIWIRRSRIGGAGNPFKGERQRTVVAAPFFHMNGLGSTLAMLAGGGLTVILPEFRTSDYVAAIRDYDVNAITTVTTMLAMVLRDREHLIPTPMEQVKIVRVGSAPVTMGLIEGIRQIFPNALIGNAYGVTEAGQIIFAAHPDGLPTPSISVGYPLAGAECRLVDPAGREGEEGVLWIRSPAVMRGYLNLPEKTREVLTADGWYCTNDIFRRDGDGFYYFVGRADDMFVCGGENVYPSEVEGLLERHPAVAQAVVVPVPDDIKGDKPVAFVVLKAGQHATPDELKGHALRHGPAYQHPRMILFRDEMPWAGTNKIDRKRLASEALAAWQERGEAC